MFHMLEIELARARMTQSQLANMMGITPTTLSLKLNGKSVLSLPECIKIKEFLASSLSIEELFSNTDNRRKGVEYATGNKH